MKMASAELRDELNCSICLNIYTDPVTLRCGHNFCRDCISRVLNTQEKSGGGHSCPDCRADFRRRPELQRNTTLCNIVQRLAVWSIQPDLKEPTGIICTYCVDFPVPAVKSCLMCEASLCDKHLRVHSKSPEHVIVDPTTSLENRKCCIHKKILEYYCTQDNVCICVSCSLAGEHRGHQVELLDEASQKKKAMLRDAVEEVIGERDVIEERLRNLQEQSENLQEIVKDVSQRATSLFGDLRRQLEDLEKRVLSEIERQKEDMNQSFSNTVHQLEVKRDELSRKICDMEELCKVTDPLTVLQEPKYTGLYEDEMRFSKCATWGTYDAFYEQMSDPAGNLDEHVILATLHTGLDNMVFEAKNNFYVSQQSGSLYNLEINPFMEPETRRPFQSGSGHGEMAASYGNTLMTLKKRSNNNPANSLTWGAQGQKLFGRSYVKYY
ncbi:tripartite motif-containing protein 12A-like [Hyperolius riggenbachi]|uniref:tripartite motif-containing protein 12A-like n=1 Tax=Hyperolius riggenbachi TaxID=752182 RepID=UPI0035A28B5A